MRVYPSGPGASLCATRPMKANEESRRVLTAFLISFVLNCILVALSFSIDPRRYPPSTFEKIVDVLDAPAGAMTDWLAPGHGGTQVAVGIVFSLAIYAVLTWVALSLPVWWRHRT